MSVGDIVSVIWEHFLLKTLLMLALFCVPTHAWSCYLLPRHKASRHPGQHGGSGCSTHCSLSPDIINSRGCLVKFDWPIIATVVQEGKTAKPCLTFLLLCHHLRTPPSLRREAPRGSQKHKHPARCRSLGLAAHYGCARLLNSCYRELTPL
jgi:hypothetical protein